mgnify:CR=1 FL=1
MKPVGFHRLGSGDHEIVDKLAPRTVLGVHLGELAAGAQGGGQGQLGVNSVRRIDGRIEQLGGSIDFKNEDLEKASKLITGAEKPNKPRHLTAPSEAKAAQTLIKRFDFNAFDDMLQARNFITNKLITLADCGDPKLELKALELLGKHSDIGLFTERSEITINHTSSESLEKSIKDRIKRLLHSDVVDVAPLDDLDLQLGPSTAPQKLPAPAPTIDELDQDGKPDA